MLRWLLLAAFVLLLNASLLLAEDADRSRKITVTGRAAGTTPAAEDEAKLDALREAVRRVCGSFINAQSEAENYSLVRDRILEQPVGFARVVKVIKGPETLAGITQVQVLVEVFPVKFEKKWAEFAHILEREGHPRCVVIVFEDDDPDDAKPPWSEGVVQTGLEDFFLDKGVRLMDKDIADEVRVRDLNLAAQSGDDQKAAALAAGFKADVVVIGQAEARRAEDITLGTQTLQRWNTSLSIRAIQTDSAALLVSRNYTPEKRYTTPAGNGRNALIHLAKHTADAVLEDIGDAWRKRATVGKIVQVRLENCGRREFKAIRSEMARLKGVNGGEQGFRLQELANQVATIEIDWRYDREQLADRFEELEVAHQGRILVLQVTELSANRLTLRLDALAPPPPTRPATTAETRPAN